MNKSNADDKKQVNGVVLTVLGLIAVITGTVFLCASIIFHIGKGDTGSDRSAELAEGASGIVSADRDSDYLEEDAVSKSDMLLDEKQVLFISSYDPTYTNYNDQINGFRSIFDMSKIRLDVVNMDSYKHHTDKDRLLFLRRITERMATDHYDGVIVADDAAFNFVMQYKNQYFKGIPVVFLGVNDYEAGYKADEDPGVTGFLESDNILDTLKLAHRFFPDASQVVGVYDNTLTGQDGYRLFLDASKNHDFDGITFTGVNFSSYSLEQFRDVMKQYGSGTIVIALSACWDKVENYYTVAEYTKIIAESTEAPVFRNATGGFYNGLVGGEVNLLTENAQDAARLMREIVRGRTDISTVQVQNNMEHRYVVNYRAMKKFGISTGLLPDNTIILDKPETFNERFGAVFYPLLIIIAGMLLMIGGSRVEVRERKTAENEQRIAAGRLRFASEHDVLTGVYNRQTGLQHMREDPRLEKEPYALMLIDGDNFKNINETYGHDRGDMVLRQLAAELMDFAAGHDAVVSRYGGDEFLILFYNCTLREGDPRITGVMEVFQKERQIDIDCISVMASIGVANSEVPGQNGDLLMCADLALAKSKARGKNTCTIFMPEMREEDLQREKLKNMVFNAIEKEEMYMLYQPQVSTETGMLEGFEALVRMKNSEIGPAVFIPLAEENGWIRRIGRITTAMTVRQIGRWLKEGYRVPPVSINYSADQLEDTGYVGYLKGLLDQYQVPPEFVKIEITESLFMDNDRQALELFRNLKEMGISLLMDDFGTGYSSLSYLAYIPVDVVKIDRSLLLAYMKEGRDGFLKDVIMLVHDLGKKTICEGVETKEQYNRLKEFTCDSIQGFYFGRPGDADAAAECMKRVSLMPEEAAK